MKKNKLYVLLLLLGVTFGAFFGLTKADATDPGGELSGGEASASVYYDEFWQATDAVVSTNTGYRNFNITSHGNTPIAAELREGNATMLPKLVVRRWTVHGHIHFE